MGRVPTDLQSAAVATAARNPSLHIGTGQSTQDLDTFGLGTCTPGSHPGLVSSAQMASPGPHWSAIARRCLCEDPRLLLPSGGGLRWERCLGVSCHQVSAVIGIYFVLLRLRRFAFRVVGVGFLALSKPGQAHQMHPGHSGTSRCGERPRASGGPGRNRTAVQHTSTFTFRVISHPHDHFTAGRRKPKVSLSRVTSV